MERRYTSGRLRKTPRSSTPRHALLHRRFPVPSIELLRRDRGRIDIVEATDIDVDLVRIRARDVERMYPAVAAERVLGHLGVELVGGQIVLAADELEQLPRHDQMQEALLAADRAVALGHTRKVGGDAKAHATTMASARHGPGLRVAAFVLSCRRFSHRFLLPTA